MKLSSYHSQTKTVHGYMVKLLVYQFGSVFIQVCSHAFHLLEINLPMASNPNVTFCFLIFFLFQGFWPSRMREYLIAYADSCENVVIEDCYISVGDDAIAIKSGWDQYGIRYGRPSSNILIRNLIVQSMVRWELLSITVSIYLHACKYMHQGPIMQRNGRVKIWGIIVSSHRNLYAGPCLSEVDTD